MVYHNVLTGKHVYLKAVEEADAEFIIKLRNDENISKFLPRIPMDIIGQIKWIKYQQSLENDYYFIIWDILGNRIGTISIYDINGDLGESGRTASFGNPIQNIEASILLLDFSFDVLGLKKIICHVFKDNHSVLRYNEKLGYEWVGEKCVNGNEMKEGLLTKERYDEYVQFYKSRIGNIK